jgi:RHS repeat-associated protein
MIGDGTMMSYNYDAGGRLVNAIRNNAAYGSYALNGLGQRVSKYSSAGNALFVYNEQGHLIGEYDTLGNLIQETVYLGDTPIAMRQGANLYYLHPDHLNTPRVITDQTNKVIWRWDSDPFGATAANEDPDGDGVTFTYNLRFPGQYYDRETGLHYNYFRDYDPRIGRYVESDPIGLKGGVNTYTYVRSNPLSLTDPLGLWVKQCSRYLGNNSKGPAPYWWSYRHDYLDVSGHFLGFYPGTNELWGKGIVGGDEKDEGRCTMLCNDDKFDAYVNAAAAAIGAPTYCPIGSIEFGPAGIAAMAAGGINCQTWTRLVIEKAKRDYLANNNCPKCFK